MSVNEEQQQQHLLTAVTCPQCAFTCVGFKPLARHMLLTMHDIARCSAPGCSSLLVRDHLLESVVSTYDELKFAEAMTFTQPLLFDGCERHSVRGGCAAAA